MVSPTVSTTRVYHLTRFKRGGIRDLASFEELRALGFLCGIFHLIDVVAHVAVAFIDDGDAIEPHLRAAEMTVVGAGVSAVVKLDVDHRRAFKPNPDLDDAVLGGDFKAMHRSVRDDRGFAVGRRDVLVAGLRAFQSPVFHRERGNDFVPNLRGLGALEVIGEKEILLFSNRLGGDSWEVRGGDAGGDEAGEREE
jgi:hypothetical protein